VFLEIEYRASPRATDAVASLGRTEDVCFSPSNRRLAVAAFSRNRIAVFDIDIASSRSGTHVALTGGVELSSPALQQPHGVGFIDDDTLIVTSRGSDVALFKLPSGERDVPSHEVQPIARWPAGGATFLNAPGSASVSRVAEDRCEILICNNNGHTVTRHLLDWSAGGAIRNSDVLLQKYLDIPDGVSVSPDRRWIAVSNHSTHNVLLYANSPALNADAEPDGILRRVYRPHGLRFSADGRYLFVADAAAPYLHIYAQHPDEWRGVRHPVSTVRIMDEAMFRRGRHNDQEGGPKGLDIDTGSNVLVGHLRMPAAHVFRPAGTVAARVRGRFNAGAEDSGHQVRTEPHARAGEAGHGSKRVTGQQVVADHRTIAAPQFHLASVHIARLATTTACCLRS
jgi:hypothetical protein